MEGQTGLLVVTALLAAALGTFAVLATQRRPVAEGGQEALLAALEARVGTSSDVLQGQLATLQAALDRRLAEDGRRVEERLRESGAALTSVREALAQVEAANRRITEVGRDISGLHDLLRSPKARGGMGELLLEDLLGEMLPVRCFELQHTFSCGTRVDAVIRLGDRLVPIDAKFPLEAGRRLAAARDSQERGAARSLLIRDVRRHVDAIAQRYVRPEDGTVDFALMYVASESVYHQAILDDGPGEDLYSYCLRRRVLPVSPNTFYAYLMSLVLGLRGLEMEERSREVLQAVDSLREGLRRFEEEHQRVGTHLGNAARAYARSERRLERWSLSLERLEALRLEEPANG